MENTQSVQQESSKVKESATISESNESTKKINSFGNVAIYLFTHYPWLFLAGLLLMFLGGGALSIYSLGYVDESIKRKDSEELEAEVIPPQIIGEAVESDENPIPLWMVAAIALSCASGCLVILKFINRPRKPKIIKRVVNRDEIRLAQRRYQAMEARLPKRKTPVYVSSHPRRTPIMAMPPQKPQPKPVVTVLPPEHSFKPDQNNQDSLADIMDIRKQNSLSSMLHK
ncbi:MAG: hypothetical protein VKN72_27330 [Nostocales cyanobacterium 94392]|nr:hypothetical protein [Nostocales cyanobacterium 94392]